VSLGILRVQQAVTVNGSSLLSNDRLLSVWDPDEEEWAEVPELASATDRSTWIKFLKATRPLRMVFARQDMSDELFYDYTFTEEGMHPGDLAETFLSMAETCLCSSYPGGERAESIGSRLIAAHVTAADSVLPPQGIGVRDVVRKVDGRSIDGLSPASIVAAVTAAKQNLTLQKFRPFTSIPESMMAVSRNSAPLAQFPIIKVINLERHSERWAAMQEAFETKLSLAVQRVDAVDAATYDDEDWNGVEAWKESIYPPLTTEIPARICCLLSHVKVWESIAAGDHDAALVLEDDVHPRRGFVAGVNRLQMILPENYDVVWVMNYAASLKWDGLQAVFLQWLHPWYSQNVGLVGDQKLRELITKFEIGTVEKLKSKLLHEPEMKIQLGAEGHAKLTAACTNLSSSTLYRSIPPEAVTSGPNQNAANELKYELMSSHTTEPERTGLLRLHRPLWNNAGTVAMLISKRGAKQLLRAFNEHGASSAADWYLIKHCQLQLFMTTAPFVNLVDFGSSTGGWGLATKEEL
jgi:GR25 family glycosyltransferase involved in LPS biosynthesis